jgi:hypothetical protein
LRKGGELRFFGLTLDLKTGAIYDNVLDRYLTPKEAAGMYFILSLYAETRTDVGESGELISLSRQLCPFIHCPNLRRNISAVEKSLEETHSCCTQLQSPLTLSQ